MINKINAIFIGVLIPLSEMNMLNKSKEIHMARFTVKITAINRSRVLIGTGKTINISQDKKCLVYFKIFGGFTFAD